MNNPRLILPSDFRLAGQDPRVLAQRTKKGELVRVRRGVYTKSSDWTSANPAERYGLQAAAFQALAPRQPVFCHATAARLWGLWIVGLPNKLHVVTEVVTSGRSNNGVIRRTGSLTDNVVQCGSFRLTDKLTTAFALIRTLSFPYAVAVCDSALRRPEQKHAVNHMVSLHLRPLAQEPSWETDGPQGPAVTPYEFRELAALLPSRAARERALTVINFASALSGSAGESISRARMHQLGFPAPILQKEFTLRTGKAAFVDFWFRDLGLAGEFDGKAKYLRADWDGGSMEERLWKEKLREDDIRSQGVRFVRWTWCEVDNRNTFEQLLRRAGLPQK